jgi:hypothetical protein
MTKIELDRLAERIAHPARWAYDIELDVAYCNGIIFEREEALAVARILRQFERAGLTVE